MSNINSNKHHNSNKRYETLRHRDQHKRPHLEARQKRYNKEVNELAKSPLSLFKKYEFQSTIDFIRSLDKKRESLLIDLKKETIGSKKRVLEQKLAWVDSRTNKMVNELDFFGFARLCYARNPNLVAGLVANLPQFVSFILTIGGIYLGMKAVSQHSARNQVKMQTKSTKPEKIGESNMTKFIAKGVSFAKTVDGFVDRMLPIKGVNAQPTSDLTAQILQDGNTFVNNVNTTYVETGKDLDSIRKDLETTPFWETPPSGEYKAHQTTTNAIANNYNPGTTIPGGSSFLGKLISFLKSQNETLTHIEQELGVKNQSEIKPEFDKLVQSNQTLTNETANLANLKLGSESADRMKNTVGGSDLADAEAKVTDAVVIKGNAEKIASELGLDLRTMTSKQIAEAYLKKMGLVVVSKNGTKNGTSVVSAKELAAIRTEARQIGVREGVGWSAFAIGLTVLGIGGVTVTIICVGGYFVIRCIKDCIENVDAVEEQLKKDHGSLETNKYLKQLCGNGIPQDGDRFGAGLTQANFSTWLEKLQSTLEKEWPKEKGRVRQALGSSVHRRSLMDLDKGGQNPQQLKKALLDYQVPATPLSLRCPDHLQSR